MASLELSVRMADYAPVKAVLDAADAVVEAKGDAPWTLTGAIEVLESAVSALVKSNNDDQDDGN